ncbi:pyridoxamine 5'-phosphate oxidase family protein [Mycobacterium sp.]|uniref:pyridoxamine 5'-phosphate oxidase family protein n=3 Tax=Mycobacterium sp. TaxID=1785 RepID=UPI003F9C0658
MTELDRAAIAMPPDAIVELLATVRTMSMATIGADGWPHVVAMWFAVHEGLITFMAYRRSRKCRNLAHDDRVTCLVEAGEQYEELRGVQIRGRAMEVAQEARLAAASAVVARYSKLPVDPGDVARQVRSRLIYAVTPVAMASWDHRRIPIANTHDTHPVEKD